MEQLLALGAAFIFALACNLDTVLLAMGYAVRGTHIPRGGVLVIALVTTAVTGLSLALGSMAARLFSPSTAQVLGGLALVGIGLWFLLDCLRQLGREDVQAPPVSRGIWGCVALSAALAVNNAGVGVAAGVAGLNVPAATAVNFAVTLLALPLGWALGRRLASRWLGGLALPLTGFLLVMLGFVEILF